MDLQPQRLKSFLAQFDSKEATSAHEDGAYAVEFLKLKRQSTNHRSEKVYSTKVADRQENVKRNRYKDIVPFDHSRVTLSLDVSKNDGDYINANFIRGVFGPTEYIATQGPLPHTVLDFWRMLWEYNVQVIVMACREFEMGRKKCERYWPVTTANAFVCEPFTAYCEAEENKGDYLIRILRVTYKNSTRTLKQLHYMNWPDHGVPDSIPPILEMLHDMRAFQERDGAPICIHCSAGCGRTGVLCVVDYTWNLLKQQMIPEDFSIYDLVQNMRRQRPSIVQTKEQYELVYRAIALLFKNHLQSVESSAKEKEVPEPPAPPPIPVDTDSDVSDFTESEEELEPVQEDTLHPSNALRCQEEEVPRESSNQDAAPESPPPHCQPQSLPEPRLTPVDMLHSMKNWARSKISSRFTATPSNPQKTDLFYQKCPIAKPYRVQKPQTSELPLLQERGHGHQKPQTSESLPLQSADLRYQISQVLEPPPGYSAGPEYPNSQVLEPPPGYSAGPEYPNSQVLEPPPGYSAGPAYPNSQVLEPPPAQPTDLRHRKPQIPKPPRILKTDLECRKSLTPEPPPVQQLIEPLLLKQSDIEWQKPHTVEPPIHKPPRHQKADPGIHKQQIPEISTSSQIQQNSMMRSNNHISSTPVHVSSLHQTHQTETNNGSAPLQTPYICLTVEDPYFGPDSSLSNESTKDAVGIPQFIENPCYIGPTLTLKTQNTEPPMQSKDTGVATSIPDEDSPPPLPARTPESYILANEEHPQIPTPTHELPTEWPLLNASDTEDKGDPGSTTDTAVDQSLTVVIPPVSFSISGEESPSSPAPPLPERTPESFEMADDGGLLQNAEKEKPRETVLRVGKSSEWSGNSTLNVPDFKRSWSRSKSLKARLSLNVPLNIQPCAPHHIPSAEPPEGRTPPVPEHTPVSFLTDASDTRASRTPPLPRRTAESFILVTEEAQSNGAPGQRDSGQYRQRLGTSSEWAGNSEPRTLLDARTRSKSVRVKSSKQECLPAVSLPDPDAGASAEPALSSKPDHRPLHWRPPATEQPETRSVPKKSRTKSLKLWKGKPKTKESHAAAAAPPPPNHGATAGFVFSFGTRFGKPKGPRGQPETWV